MTDNWDRTIFDRDLKAILESKLPVSASKITSLQALATAHPQHHNYIVQCIIRFIETSPPDYRLAGLYVIDAISRAVHKHQRKREENNEGPSELDGYLKRFAISLKDSALFGCFEPCSTKDKDKVKKTLDFWEQGNVYSKDVVQYLKHSFLKGGNGIPMADEGQQQSKAPPPMDTASLLATLSNIGNGSLANLNIPGMTPPPAAPAPAPTPAPIQPVQNDQPILPPALAKLLGGLVSTPIPPPAAAPMSPTTSDPRIGNGPRMNSDPRTSNDPRVNSDPRLSNDPRTNNDLRMNNDPRTRNDPRMRNDPRVVPEAPAKNAPIWPPPKGPSISNTRTGERKSRWSSANDTNAASPIIASPPQQQQQPMVPDAWQQRQPTQDGRFGANNYQNQPYQNAPQQAYQQPYPQKQAFSQQLYQQQLPYQQPKAYNTPQSYQQPQQDIQRGADPVSDPSLPPGCIRVLTRTLFVGPIPDHFEKGDVTQLFSQYGELASVIVARKHKGRHNAFLKFTTRSATEAAKYDSDGLVVEGVPVKVNWAFGFGPKKHFNYDRGDSIIPLSELSSDEKDTLMRAPVGGFQGQPVREQMTIEEPEAQYRPEWKNNSNGGGYNNDAQRGFKRQQGGMGSGANFEEINTERKRGRFGPKGGSDDGYNQGFSRPYDSLSPVRNGGGQNFYQQQHQYPQQFGNSSSIPYSGEQ